MELKFVIPNMEKTFGNLEFAGEDKTEQKRINGRMAVLSRSFNLYSDVQRADDIVVILPAEAGEKHFDFEERVKLVNPLPPRTDQQVNGDKGSGAQHGVREHIDYHVRSEPRALQSGHQGLVMYLRLKQIDTDKDKGQQCTKGKYPFIPPTDISDHARHRQEKRIP